METIVISKQSLDTFTHDKNVVGITQQDIMQQDLKVKIGAADEVDFAELMTSNKYGCIQDDTFADWVMWYKTSKCPPIIAQYFDGTNLDEIKMDDVKREVFEMAWRFITKKLYGKWDGYTMSGYLKEFFNRIEMV